MVGSEVASAFGSWRWGLRVSPPIGVVLVILTAIFMQEPPRGGSDGNNGRK